VLGIGLAAWGYFVITPAAQQLQSSASEAEFAARLDRVKKVTVAELFGFALILIFMVAMRFGY
jgi:hypothetical protein